MKEIKAQVGKSFFANMPVNTFCKGFFNSKLPIKLELNLGKHSECHKNDIWTIKHDLYCPK